MRNNVRVLRKARGWSMEKLARETELSRQTISDLELGRMAPRMGTAVRIAEALDTDLDSLFPTNGQGEEA